MNVEINGAVSAELGREIVAAGGEREMGRGRVAMPRSGGRYNGRNREVSKHFFASYGAICFEKRPSNKNC